MDKDRCAACQENLIGIGYPVGGGNDDFVTFLDQGLGNVVEGMFCPASDGNLVTGECQSVIPLKFGDNGIFQFDGAANRGVAGVSGVDRLLCGFPDIQRCAEVGFSGAEADDVDALGLEGLCLGIDDEGW